MSMIEIYGYSSNELIFKPNKNKSRISKTLKARVYKRDNYTCVKCGNNSKNYLTLDHIVPRVYGGKNNYHNLQVLCDKCNNEKGCKTINYLKKKNIRRKK